MNEAYQETIVDETEEELSPEELRMISLCRFGGKVLVGDGDSQNGDWVYLGRKGKEVFIGKSDGTEHTTMPLDDFLELNKLSMQ